MLGDTRPHKLNAHSPTLYTRLPKLPTTNDNYNAILMSNTVYEE